MIIFVFSCILFFLAVPGIVLCIPRNGNKYNRAAVHSILFGLVFTVGYNCCIRMSRYGPTPFEGFSSSEAAITGNPSKVTTNAVDMATLKK